ncbi:hypothetical protein ACFIJ5_07370 [Haloimpatiens sp. FM7330]|uniref:hypothetical protein n=1 Tax=Haloimpatiens sp. FM7330 TaxID=3298610 RepID=UPI0036367BA6
MNLKCIKDNHGYYTVGECYPIIDRICNDLVIKINKGWTHNKEVEHLIHCLEEDIEKGYLRIFKMIYKFVFFLFFRI